MVLRRVHSKRCLDDFSDVIIVVITYKHACHAGEGLVINQTNEEDYFAKSLFYETVKPEVMISLFETVR